jgi:tetratricopeptide (TPR) repeat protein
VAGIPAGVILVVILLLLGGLGFGSWWMFARSGESAAVERGIAAYSAGQRERAEAEFQKAARDDPRLATPHIYLGRIARERGDMTTASRELQTAISLEPTNSVALREMGSYLLAARNYELARRFYVRAIEANPEDRTAQGFLGCALARLGRMEEANRWLTRAGQGAWSPCAQIRAMPGGAPVPGQPVPPGAPPA